jgi:Zn ribbon nucleic-acid-binding protein
MKEKGIHAEQLKDSKGDTFQMLVEEDELAKTIKQCMYQQEKIHGSLSKHLQMNEQCLSELEENYDDKSHANK